MSTGNVQQGAVSKSDNYHKIMQTDQGITVVVYDNDSKPESGQFEMKKSNISGGKMIDHYKQNDEDTSKSDQKTYESIKKKTTSLKKCVSFNQNNEIEKFIEGEEIIDKQNPFRQTIGDNSPEHRGNETNKSHFHKQPFHKLNIEEVGSIDFISKDEILKQSKFVPTYIKNPDRILTYDKSVLEKITNVPTCMSKRNPVPTPRKKVNEPSTKHNNQKRITKDLWNNLNYPDFANIKVR